MSCSAEEASNELRRYIPTSLSGTRCMRRVLRSSVSRRRLLTLSARLSLATFASAIVSSRPGASESGLVQGFANGDGVRLSFVHRGKGALMLFLHGHPDSWTLY